LLEAEKRKGNWYEVRKGFAKTLIEHIANDTKGSFHGLGFWRDVSVYENAWK